MRTNASSSQSESYRTCCKQLSVLPSALPTGSCTGQRSQEKKFPQKKTGVDHSTVSIRRRKSCGWGC